MGTSASSDGTVDGGRGPDEIGIDFAPAAASLLGAIAAVLAAAVASGFKASAVPLLTAACVGCSVGFSIVEIGRTRAIPPAFLFVLGLAYYHLVIPVEYVFDPKAPREFIDAFPSFTEEHLVTPLVATLLALFGFIVGYLPRRRWAAPAPVRPPLDTRRLLVASAVIAGIGLAMYLAMSVIATGSIFGIFSTTYRERDELFYGMGVLGAGILLVYVGVACAAVVLLRRPGFVGPLLAAGLCALMGLHSFLVGSKMHAFRVGLGVLVAVPSAPRAARRIALPLLVVSLALPLLFVGLARNKQGEGLGAMAEFVVEEADADTVNPANIDSWGPYLTLTWTVATARVPDDLRWGRTYVDGLAILVPRFLYPGRPQPLDEEFAANFAIDGYDNAGYAFSGVAEAYLNFGLPGCVVVFLLFGLVFGAIRDAIARRPGSLAAMLLYATAASWIALSLRGAVGALVKMYGLMTLVPTLAIVGWAWPRRAAKVGADEDGAPGADAAPEAAGIAER